MTADTTEEEEGTMITAMVITDTTVADINQKRASRFIATHLKKTKTL